MAIKDENEALTYEELLKRSKETATWLLSDLPEHTRNRPIAVIADRNVWSVVAFMGILYSGNFYVPIDYTMPEERIKLIYDTLDPIKVIDTRAKPGNAPDNTVHIMDVLEAGRVDEDALDGIREGSIDTDPIYGIFTSGSTGVPKGIVPSHRSVIDLIDAFDKAFDLDENMVHGSQAPLDFDAFTKDLYNSLHNGSTVVIIPKKLFSMPALLMDFLADNGVNIIVWAVSACRIVSDFRTFDSVERKPDLKYVMFSGEVMPIKSLNYWIDNIPGAQYVNLYGPTETTCNCTYYIVTERQDEMKPLPIGRPFANTRVKILDDKREKVITKPQERGELCVAGTCLAHGYWGDHKRTKEAFFLDPTITEYDSILYGTGDIAYYAEDGQLMFVSRRDYQIKHMGHRIELGEVETALNSVPFIDVACCLYDNVKGKIVCFYQSEVDDPREITKTISKLIPKFMWPNIYRRYDKLPLNKNGKIDRAKLKEEL